MTKNDLQIIALRLYNMGILNFDGISNYQELKRASDKEVCKCLDYIDEIIRTGKSEYKKRYLIK